MNNLTEEILTVDFDEFVEGNSSKFNIEEGSYDSAEVVGYSIVNATFEGKETKRVHLIWQFSDGENVHTIRGNGWTISANEKSTFRKEISNWFNTIDWGNVCDIFVKGGILVKGEDGKAHFELDKFIGKKGKLLIQKKTSKAGKSYAVIASISPCKNKKATFEHDSVPAFMVEGDDVLEAKLADGITVRRKEENAEEGGKAEQGKQNTAPNADTFEEDLPF